MPAPLLDAMLYSLFAGAFCIVALVAAAYLGLAFRKLTGGRRFH
jgi:hypothetical protein